MELAKMCSWVFVLRMQVTTSQFLVPLVGLASDRILGGTLGNGWHQLSENNEYSSPCPHVVWGAFRSAQKNGVNTDSDDNKTITGGVLGMHNSTDREPL